MRKCKKMFENEKMRLLDELDTRAENLLNAKMEKPGYAISHVHAAASNRELTKMQELKAKLSNLLGRM